MKRIAVRMVALVLRLTWLAAILAVVLLVAVAQVAPRDGRSMFIVRGQSMAPAITVGTLIVAVPVPASELRAGDVVSIRRGQTVVTHRIVDVNAESGELRFQTKGDANETADAVLATPADVIGRVGLWIPLAGFLLAFLGEPVGIAAVLSFLGTLLLARWFVDDLATTKRPRPVTTAPEAAHSAVA